MTDTSAPTPTIDLATPTNTQVSETVRNLYLNANLDVLSLIAGSINLYAEAKGRLTAKRDFTPEDARRTLDIVMILLDTPTVAQDFTGAKVEHLLKPRERRQ